MRAPTTSWLRRHMRITVRAAMAAVALCGLWMSCLEFQIARYRDEWQREQDVLSEIRADGGQDFTVVSTVVGPLWVRKLAGPSRSKCFHRVRYLLFVASDTNAAAKRMARLRYLEAIVGL